MPKKKSTALPCRINCSAVFQHKSNRISHERDKCSVYGGEVDKRKKAEFALACDASKNIDGSLLHTSRIFEAILQIPKEQREDIAIDGLEVSVSEPEEKINHLSTSTVNQSSNIQKQYILNISAESPTLIQQYEDRLVKLRAQLEKSQLIDTDEKKTPPDLIRQYEDRLAKLTDQLNTLHQNDTQQKTETAVVMPLLISCDYVYIVMTRHAYESNDPVYKIGRCENMHRRLSGYPKGTIVLISLRTKDAQLLEKKIKKAFESDTLMHKATEYGNEYFRGELHHMLQRFQSIHLSHNFEI